MLLNSRVNTQIFENKSIEFLNICMCIGAFIQLLFPAVQQHRLIAFFYAYPKSETEVGLKTAVVADIRCEIAFLQQSVILLILQYVFLIFVIVHLLNWAIPLKYFFQNLALLIYYKIFFFFFPKTQDDTY